PETLPLPSGPARLEWRRSARARRITLRIDPAAGTVVVTLPNRAGRTAGLSGEPACRIAAGAGVRGWRVCAPGRGPASHSPRPGRPRRRLAGGPGDPRH